MVLVDSRGISRVPRYSGTCPASQFAVIYRAVTVYGRSFQIVRLRCWFVTPYDGPYNPLVHARGFGLFRVRSPLLAESLLFSLPAGTEMVHFPALPSHRLLNSAVDPSGLAKGGFPIRRSPGQSLFAAHRGLSQLIASFIDSWSQGIHRTPLVA